MNKRLANIIDYVHFMVEYMKQLNRGTDIDGAKEAISEYEGLQMAYDIGRYDAFVRMSKLINDIMEEDE